LDHKNEKERSSRYFF